MPEKKNPVVVEKTKLLERSVFRQVSGTSCAGTLAMPELRQEKKSTVRDVRQPCSTHPIKSARVPSDSVNYKNQNIPRLQMVNPK